MIVLSRSEERINARWNVWHLVLIFMIRQTCCCVPLINILHLIHLSYHFIIRLFSFISFHLSYTSIFQYDKIEHLRDKIPEYHYLVFRGFKWHDIYLNTPTDWQFLGKYSCQVSYWYAFLWKHLFLLRVMQMRCNKTIINLHEHGYPFIRSSTFNIYKKLNVHPVSLKLMLLINGT